MLSFAPSDSTSRQHEIILPTNKNKILVTPSITVYAFSQTAPRKSGHFVAV